MNNFEIQLVIWTFIYYLSKIFIREHNLSLHSEFSDEMIEDDELYGKYLLRIKLSNIVETFYMISIVNFFIVPFLLEADWKGILAMTGFGNLYHYFYSTIVLIFFYLLTSSGCRDVKHYFVYLYTVWSGKSLLKFQAVRLFGERAWTIARMVKPGVESNIPGILATVYHLKTKFELIMALVVMMSLLATMIILKSFL